MKTPAKRRPPRLTIDRPDQLKALTSPVRVELLELFGIWEPCAVTDIAPLMGREPDALYYHVRKLVAAGLLVAAGTRRSSPRVETLYQLPAARLEVPRKARTRAAQETTLKAVTAILRLAGREFSAAMGNSDVTEAGVGRTFYGGRQRARLSRAELRTLNRHLDGIEALFANAASKRRRATRSIAVTIVMSPAGRT